VWQLAQRLGGYSGLAMVGTSKTIADEMEEWLFTEGSDGFTVMFPYLPGGLDDLSRTSFQSYVAAACFDATMRGRRCASISALPRPQNRFFPSSMSREETSLPSNGELNRLSRSACSPVLAYAAIRTLRSRVDLQTVRFLSGPFRTTMLFVEAFHPCKTDVIHGCVAAWSRVRAPS